MDPIPGGLGGVHFGATTNAGHYRSLLKVQPRWHFTQDGVKAKPQTLQRPHRKNVYAIWLQCKAAEDPEPAPIADHGNADHKHGLTGGAGHVRGLSSQRGHLSSQ